MTRLFNLLTLLSLLLGAAVAALWERSYDGRDRIIYQTDEDARGRQRCFVLGWSRGVFDFQHHHIAGLGRAYAEWMGLHMDHSEPAPEAFAPRPESGFALLGFGFLRPTTKLAPPAVWWRYSVYVPHYAVALAAGILPAAWLRRRWLRSDRRGLCRACGYDLRATPDRCPECGATAKS